MPRAGVAVLVREDLNFRRLAHFKGRDLSDFVLVRTIIPSLRMPVQVPRW